MLNVVGAGVADLANTALASGESRAYMGLAPAAGGNPFLYREDQNGTRTTGGVGTRNVEWKCHAGRDFGNP